MIAYLETLGRKYIENTFKPYLHSLGIGLGDLDIVIGGSVSTGFADSKSDIDVYVLFEESRRDEILKARSQLFMPIKLQDSHIQIVPYPANTLNTIANATDIPKEIAIESLYDLAHYIPVIEPTVKFSIAKKKAQTLSDEFWEDRLDRRVSSLIDLVEGFYRGANRKDIETSLMMYAPTIQGIYQAGLLGTKKLYPIPKWIISECRRTDIEMIQQLVTQSSLGNQSLSCDVMTNIVRDCLSLLCGWLKENTSLHHGIIDDLEVPDRHHQ